MVVTAFVLGFFTAIGWWSAGKITNSIDKHVSAEKVIVVEKKKEE